MVVTELFINMNVFLFKKNKKWKHFAKIRQLGVGEERAARPREMQIRDNQPPQPQSKM